MKILFTDIGRRIELTQAFRNAAKNLNIDLKIYGVDMAYTAPALYFCDKWIIVPPIADDSYIPTLLNICKDEGIDALIPTIDTDLAVLSKNRDTFLKAGTKVVISDEDIIEKCFDKRLTADYFVSLGLKTPYPVENSNDYEGGYPAFIKPKNGSASLFAYKVDDEDALETYTSLVPDYIVQPFISGTEYTVDVFCDFDGNPIYITPRIRLAVRSGEVLKTQISNDEKIISDVMRILKDMKPCGAVTVQLIRRDDNGEDYYIEINPRFGGGAPLTMKAGADSASALLRLIRGEKLSYVKNAAEDGAIFCRFDQSIPVK